MAEEQDYLGEFLARIEPYLSQWRSLKFACMAVNLRNEWVQFAGRATLSTEPYEPHSALKRIVDLDYLRAYEASFQVQTIHSLIRNLAESMVISESASGDDIRLMPTGSSPYRWYPVSVRSSPLGLNSGRPWPSILCTYGMGSLSESLFPSNFWNEVDRNLLRHDPPFNRYVGLCANLGLDYKQLQSTPHFELCAELPARFVSGDVNRKSKCLELRAEYVGTPELVIEWFPTHQTKKESVPRGDPEVPKSYQINVTVPPGATEVEAKLIAVGEESHTFSLRVKWENILLRLCEFFDPGQTDLSHFLFDEINLKNVNPFELGVAKLLGLAGYAVLWFGRGKKGSLPDIVAYVQEPLGEERIIFGECTLKNPAEKFSDFAKRKVDLGSYLGVPAETILPVVFVRNSTTVQNRREASEFGLVLCDGNDIRQLQDKLQSDASPDQVFQFLQSLGSFTLIPGEVTDLFT